jgi:hypothetical protein
MIYIDLNMVRAGVVQHPSEYSGCGYNEMMDPPERYLIINREKLLDYFSIQDENYFRQEYAAWVDKELHNNALTRNPLWSESIAVGSESFITNTREKLASRARKRSTVSTNNMTVLKEPHIPYNAHFDAKKVPLSPENAYFEQTND